MFERMLEGGHRPTPEEIQNTLGREAGPISRDAAAVIRKVRALSGFIGFKGSVGRRLSVL